MADVRLIATREYKSFLERYIKELHEVDAPMIAGAVERCLYKLEGQPTVDAVPVVRCRDCRKCSIRNDVITRQKEYICLLTRDHREVEADDFCSEGERKEN